MSIKRFRKESLSALEHKKSVDFGTCYLLLPALVCVSFLCFVLLLCPLFELGVFIVVSFTLAFYIISYFKFAVLKEPLVITDFYLLKEIILKPSFYFSYVKTRYYLVIALALALLLYILLIIDYTYVALSVRVVCAFISVVCLLTALFISGRYNLEYDALFDGAALSVFSAFFVQCIDLIRSWHYIHKHSLTSYLQHKGIESEISQANLSECKTRYAKDHDILKDSAETCAKKNIILMQSESYCSLYRLGLDTKPGFIDKSSTICKRSLLDIDYLGAYTMRSEFSVLTGIERKKLGIFAYDPYILLSRYKFPSLVSKLKSRGYTCICIHPNSKYFFSRHKVMRNLGFDLFISKEIMGDNLAFKAMNSDMALCKYILKLLDTDNKNDTASLPRELTDVLCRGSGRVFIFAITMAAHGPYSVSEYKKRHLKAHSATNDGCPSTPLEIYRRRQHDFDCAIEHLVCALDSSTSLIVYGDHLPSLEDIYATDERLKPDIFAYNISAYDKSDVAKLNACSSDCKTVHGDVTCELSKDLCADHTVALRDDKAKDNTKIAHCNLDGKDTYMMDPISVHLLTLKQGDI